MSVSDRGGSKTVAILGVGVMGSTLPAGPFRSGGAAAPLGITGRNAKRAGALAEPRDGIDDDLHAGAEPIDVERSVADSDAHERRAQYGVALGDPHQGLGVAHAATTLDGPRLAPWSCRRLRATARPAAA